MGRVGRGDAAQHAMSLDPHFFDILHLDGRDLIDEPLSARAAALAAVTGDRRIRSVVTDDPAVAEAFMVDALAAGHEGVVVKAVESLYLAGRRGKAWRKIKPVHTLDLVVHRRGVGQRPSAGMAEQPASRRAGRPGSPGDGGQDVQGPDRPAADAGRPSSCWPARRDGTATSCGSAPSWWWRSPSTARRRPRATRAASPSGSRGSAGTGRTRTRPTRTPSTPCAPSSRGRGRDLDALRRPSRRPGAGRPVPGRGSGGPEPCRFVAHGGGPAWITRSLLDRPAR